MEINFTATRSQAYYGTIEVDDDAEYDEIYELAERQAFSSRARYDWETVYSEVDIT